MPLKNILVMPQVSVASKRFYNQKTFKMRLWNHVAYIL